MTYQVSALQSLLQLSIALNLGFLGYASLSGDKLEREESLLNDLILLTEAISRKAPSDQKASAECQRISSECVQLKEKYKSAQSEIDKFTRGKYRLSIIISALLSFIGLAATSYYDFPLSLPTFIASIALYAPFIFMLFQRYRITTRHSTYISTHRTRLDIELANLNVMLAERA